MAMSKNPDNLSPEAILADCRARIDAMDEHLSQKLIERTGIIAEVAALKAKHWPGRCHIRPAREGQMHEAMAKRFEGTDIPPIAALAIWRQMIGAATSLESPLSCVSLVHEPHHAWLAREYFGAGVGNHVVTSLAEQLEVFQRGVANIVLLPTAESSDWWRDAPLFAKHNLKIFATLPVSTQPLPHGVAPAFALAPVAPEPSGNDLSYFAIVTKQAVDTPELQALVGGHVISANPTHHLLVRDGFIAEGSSDAQSIARAVGDRLLTLTALGTHPRAVSL